MAHAHTSSNPNDFILPDLGEGVHEAELIKWRVEVGQAVKEHDILAEMETDKALVEVPSPRTGVIAALHGKEGEVLHVGNALVTFAGDGGAVETKPAAHAEATAGDNGTHEAGCDMSDQIASHVPASSNGTTESGEREDAGTVVGSVGGALGGVTAEAGKALATPAVRRLARDLGVDIDRVKGTGLAGRVTEKDVRATGKGGAVREEAPRAAARQAAPQKPLPQGRGSSAPAAPTARPSAPASAPRTQDSGVSSTPIRTPFRGVRRTIANRLRESVNQAVHFNVMDEADVTVLDGLRRKLAAASGEKVSFLPFVASAVCHVLLREEFRSLNATVDEKANDPNYDAAILTHRAVHMGIATDTDTGLMVPVIRDCDALGVLEIGRAITGIAAAARDRSIARENLMGSTFTISNVGSHAGRFATPIINYPEVAILAVGRGRQAPVIRSTSAGPAFAVGQMLPLSLACDHRVVDGATGALALAEIIKLLQEPEGLLGPARG